MKLCKHQDCAVCRDIGHRNIFEYILNKRNPDVYLCSHARYVATNYKGEKFYLNIDNIHKGKSGYYTIDPYRGQPIYLNKKNFMVICKIDACRVTPHVVEYIIEQQERDD